MKIIGLTGLARSGKSTLAEHLCLKHNYVELAFADPLKIAAQYIFGLTTDQADERAKNKVVEYWGMTPRQMYQKLGTEVIREQFGPDVWVKRLALSLGNLSRDYPQLNAVISDVRFPEEAAFVKSRGGVLVRIVRHGAGLTGAEGAHASEAGVFEADYVIPNDGPEDALFACGDAIVGAL